MVNPLLVPVRGDGRAAVRLGLCELDASRGGTCGRSGLVSGMRLRPPRQPAPLPGVRRVGVSGGPFVRRVTRRLFTWASAVSLVLGAGVGASWVRTCEQEWRIARTIRGDLHTLSSSHGKLTLFAPPSPAIAAPSAAAGDAMEELVAQLRNDQ